MKLKWLNASKIVKTIRQINGYTKNVTSTQITVVVKINYMLTVTKQYNQIAKELELEEVESNTPVQAVKCSRCGRKGGIHLFMAKMTKIGILYFCPNHY